MSLLHGRSKDSVRATLLAAGTQRVTPSTALLIDLLAERAASCITAFISMKDEPDTYQLRSAVAAARVSIALPILLEDNSLAWALDSEQHFRGLRGTSYPAGAPVSLDVVDVMVVPALAIDHSGQRLGRGGGSYDRALAQFRAARPDGLVIAWINEADLVAEVPAEDHDQPVDAAITERRILWFRLSNR